MEPQHSVSLFKNCASVDVQYLHVCFHHSADLAKRERAVHSFSLKAIAERGALLFGDGHKWF